MTSGAYHDDAHLDREPRGFLLLPPMVQDDPEAPGPLDGDLVPFLALSVCAWDDAACIEPVERITSAGALVAGADVRLSADGVAVSVDWPLGTSGLDVGQYRVRVGVGSYDMGGFDLRVHAAGGAAPPAGPFIDAPADSTLPVRFLVTAEPVWHNLPGLVAGSDAVRPGAPFTLEGTSGLFQGTSAVEVYVHGEPAPFMRSPAGDHGTAAAPMFLEDGWSAPPEGPVDVVVLMNGEPVARARDLLEILPLQEAPGAAASALEALVRASASLRSIGALVPDTAGVEAQYLEAMTVALEELVAGHGEHSLAGSLTALESDADALRLMDAWFASSEMVTVLGSAADALEDLDAAFADAGMPVEGPALAPAIATDLDLARRMQLYSMVKLFGETVVSGTASTFGEYIGTAAGAIGIVKGVPGVAITSAVLAVADFVMNKVVVGLMPASIDDFALQLTSTSLSANEITDAHMTLTASNDPPPIGVQDMVGLILAGLGLGDGPSSASLKGALLNVANFYLSTAQAALASYANKHPELNLDVNLVSMPDLEWSTSIEDPRLVELHSFTPEIIDGIENDVNWQASASGFGEGRIYARTSTKPEAVLVSPPLGVEYNGGAFGEGVIDSNVVTVQVAGDLVVEVDFSEQIEPDQWSALDVRAGYLDAVGDTLWTEALDVSLTYYGGQVQHESGVTDAEGRFATVARLDEGSDEIIITVTVTGILGEYIDRTVIARYVPLAVVVMTYNETYVEANARQNLEPDNNAYSSETVVGDDPNIGFAPSLSASSSGSVPDPFNMASAQGSVSGEHVIELESGTGHVTVIRSSAQASASATRTMDGNTEVAAMGRLLTSLRFEVVGPEGSGVPFRFTVTCTGPDAMWGGLDGPGGTTVFYVDDGPGCRTEEITGVLVPGLHYLEMVFTSSANLWMEGQGVEDQSEGSFEFRLEFGGEG